MTHVRRALTTSLVSLALAVPAVATFPARALAQSDAGTEIKVLVAPLQVAAGVDSKFGGKVAEEVRKSLEDFSGMTAVKWGDVKKMLKQFELDASKLSLIEWRQLAGRMNAGLVMVGTVARGGSGLQVDAKFMDPRSGDELPVPAFSVSDAKAYREAAQHIRAGLETQVAYQRSVVFCSEYLGSKQLDDALRNCQEALQVNPNSTRALYLRGRIYMESEDWENARRDLARVVEASPSNTDALQSLAYTNAQLGNTERAQELYQEYLNFNPDAADVRLNVAFKLAQAGAYAEAMSILQEGVRRDSTNATMWKYLGDIALAKGTTRPQGADDGEAGGLADPAAVRTSVEAYDHLLTLKGDSIDPGILTNVIKARMELGDLDEALAFSDRALRMFQMSSGTSGAAAPGNGPAGAAGGESAAPAQTREELMAGIHSLRADVYSRKKDYASAVAEMDQVIRLAPSYPDGHMKRGVMRLKIGDSEGAVADFEAAVADGSDANAIGQTLFGSGYQDYFQKKRYPQAIRMFNTALRFARAPGLKHQVHFFAGYGFYQQGTGIDKRNEAAEACGPARRALGLFRQVLPHMNQAGNYQPAAQKQIRDAVDVQIYRQEQIIKKSCK